VATQEAAGPGELLKQWRVAAGLTQEELAERAGVSARSVSDLERGLNRTPRPSTIRRLADALDLTQAQRKLLLTTGSQVHADDSSRNLIELVPTRRTMLVRPRWRVVALAAVCVLAVMVGPIFLALRSGRSSVGALRVHSGVRAPVVLAAWGTISGRPPASGDEIEGVVPGPNGTGYALAFGATITVLRFSASGEQLSAWTIPGTSLSHAIRIGDAKVDAHGNLWVTTDANDVREYSPDGQLLARWGGAGFSPNPGQYWYPLGLGLASNGEVVVGDAGSHRIQVLNPTGKPILQWSGPGISPQILQRFVPRAIGMDKQDDVYVLDTGNWGLGNYQVEKYTMRGKLLAILHPPGLKYTHSDCGPSLTIDRHSNLYVLDCGRTYVRIDKLDPGGRELATWTSLGTHPRVAREMTIIAFNGQGVGYVTVRGSPAVLKIDETGHVLASWTARQLRQPLFRSPVSVSADRAGTVSVTDRGRVVRLSNSGLRVQRWRVRGAVAGASSVVAIDPEGAVVVLEGPRGSIATYSASGGLLSEWGKRSFALGHLDQAAAIGVDGNRNIEVLDTADNLVQTFTPSGRLIRSWSIEPYRQTSHIPGGMAVNSQGDVYLLIDDRILELSPQGLPIRSWGSAGAGPGRFLDPRGVAVDSRGNVYATDAGQNSLQVFSASGKLLASWTGLGPKGPRFEGLGTLTVDDQGDIFVLNGAQLVELAPRVSL
jgi:DNA-binding beta-propeller fold protein YncE/transcriptional regulator with XRE-family HTH domain